MTGSHEQREATTQSSKPFAVQMHGEEGQGAVQAHADDGGGDDVQAHAEEGGSGPVQAKVAPLMSHWAEGAGPVQKKEDGDQAPVQMHGDDDVQMAKKKAVSGKAMKRLGDAREAIEHVKSVIAFGAGNQAEALKATNFNSYFRMKAMRDASCWEMTATARRLGAQDPAALTAAKADLAQGGNCGEHAVVAFDYLRAKGTGDPIAVSSKSGLDHAFVLIGDLSEGDEDIVVSDPWPTAATATTWGDHFAYTGDRSEIERSYTATSDGSSAKEAIKAGLKLSAKGLQMINSKMSDEETDKEIDKSMGGWIWGHEDAAAQGKKHDYVERRAPGGGGAVAPRRRRPPLPVGDDDVARPARPARSGASPARAGVPARRRRSGPSQGAHRIADAP